MPSPPPLRRSQRARIATVVIFLATVVQLAVATAATDLPQFAGKGFGARLVAYPLLMLLVPAAWWAHRSLSVASSPVDVPRDVPWTAFALAMAPFLIDVTGNSANLYDAVPWWDDANHFVNWALLCGGLGLLLARAAPWSPWLLTLLIAGTGAALAIGWEVGEWYAFIRHGTELDTAYEDTLLDEVLGTLGATVAGALVAWAPRRRLARAGGPAA